MFALPLWLISVGGWVKAGVAWCWELATEYPRTMLAILACIAAWWAHGWDLDRKLAAQQQQFNLEKQRAALAFDAALKRKRQEVADLELAQAAINDGWRTSFNLAMQQADERRLADLAKVPRYVTPLADSRCVVPVGFLQLAAEGVRAANGDSGAGRSLNAETVSQEALELVDRASGVPLSAISAWQRDFAAVAEKWRARALMCDQWVDQQAAEFNKDRKGIAP